MVKIGADGFKHFHRCQEVGYKPMEAVNFLKECETCHQYFVSVARLVLHCLLHHFRLSSLMCSCGKSFYNKGVFDLHMWCGTTAATRTSLSSWSTSLDLRVLKQFLISFTTVICKLFLFFFSSLYIFHLQDSPAIVINVIS